MRACAISARRTIRTAHYIQPSRNSSARLDFGVRTRCNNDWTTVLAQGAKNVREVAPLFAELLSIPTAGRYPPLDLTPAKLKQKTLHAKVAKVEGLAARQPVLMVSEDAYWSDPASLELLDLLIERISTLRLIAPVAAETSVCGASAVD
jgi:predicted ATPase